MTVTHQHFPEMRQGAGETAGVLAMLRGIRAPAWVRATWDVAAFAPVLLWLGWDLVRVSPWTRLKRATRKPWA